MSFNVLRFCVCVAFIYHKTLIETRKEKFKIAERWQKKI